MSERRENSVLFSLKELRNIEDGRVQKEKDDARSRADAERAAHEATLRAAREAEERGRREEEDRLRRIEEEKESRAREEQIRLQEAERRARVEGEVRLQEQRMHLDAQAKRETKSPLKAIMGVTVVLVLVAGGLGYKMYSDHQAELAVERANSARIEAEAKAASIESERKLAAITKDMNDKLASAKTEEDKARIRAEAAQQRVAAAPSHSGHRTTVDKPAAPPAPSSYRKIGKKDVTDNPLDGL